MGSFPQASVLSVHQDHQLLPPSPLPGVKTASASRIVQNPPHLQSPKMSSAGIKKMCFSIFPTLSLFEVSSYRKVCVYGVLESLELVKEKQRFLTAVRLTTCGFVFSAKLDKSDGDGRMQLCSQMLLVQSHLWDMLWPSQFPALKSKSHLYQIMLYNSSLVFF